MRRHRSKLFPKGETPHHLRDGPSGGGTRLTRSGSLPDRNAVGELRRCARHASPGRASFSADSTGTSESQMTAGGPGPRRHRTWLRAGTVRRHHLALDDGAVEVVRTVHCPHPRGGDHPAASPTPEDPSASPRRLQGFAGRVPEQASQVAVALGFCPLDGARAGPRSPRRHGWSKEMRRLPPYRGPRRPPCPGRGR